MDKKILWAAFCDETLDKLSNTYGVGTNKLSEYASKAVELAEIGDGDAQFLCGFLSLIGPDHDPTWLYVAARKKNADAHTALGMALYCLPTTTPRSETHETACLHFVNASMLGDEFAEKMRQILVSEGEEYDNEHGVEYVSPEMIKTLVDDAETEVVTIAENIAEARSNSVGVELDFKADEDADRQSADLENITRGFVSDPSNKFYVTPDLPIKKVRNFVAGSKHYIDDNSIIFYFDETVFGSGDNGVAVSLDSVIINVSFCKNRLIPIHMIQDVEISGLVHRNISLQLTDNSTVTFKLTQSNTGALRLKDAIHGLL